MILCDAKIMCNQLTLILITITKPSITNRSKVDFYLPIKRTDYALFTYIDFQSQLKSCNPIQRK